MAAPVAAGERMGALPMSTRIYTLPVEHTQWHIPGHEVTTVFNWDYDEGRDKLLNLYEKGKTSQWNASDRIDWSVDVDLDNPMGFPDEFIPIFGSRVWDRLSPQERGQVRHHFESWRFSQFLHGEQGALICTAKIVQTVPDLDSKFYAATQVIDEARHVEVYKRYLLEKLGMAYPINVHLATLIGQGITDRRWDMTYLAMQVIIEGLALAAFNLIRDAAKDPLGRSINAYVMQDEARHVAFGRLALRDFYPHLEQHERDEREEFCVEALYLMRDRFQAEEVWGRCGLPVPECTEFVDNSAQMKQFRSGLFTRIVPTLKDIGLWGPRIRKALVDMDVMKFADLELDELGRHDDTVAAEFDRLTAHRRAARNPATAAA
jgi:hypothetical protein